MYCVVLGFFYFWSAFHAEHQANHSHDNQKRECLSLISSFPSTEVPHMAMENPPFESMYFLVNMVMFKLVMLVFRDVQEVPRLLSLFEKRIWIYKVETSQSEKSSVWSLHSQVSTREDLVQMDPASVLFTNFAIAMIVDDPPYFCTQNKSCPTNPHQKCLVTF